MSLLALLLPPLLALLIADGATAQLLDRELPPSRIVSGRRAVEVATTADVASLLSRYDEVLSFPYRGDEPFGSLNPMAPPETEEFGQLAGIWYVEQHSFFQGQWYCCWNAFWAWRYVIDGFGVQDLWYQPRENLPPTSTLERDLALTQLRVYRPASQDWFVAFITGNGADGGANNGTFRAVRVGADVVMTRTDAVEEGAPTTRIVFFQIEENRWRWRQDRLEEDGVTWSTTAVIEAHRLRPSGDSTAPAFRRSTRDLSGR